MKYLLFFIAVLIATAYGYLVCGPEDLVAGTTQGIVVIILMAVIDSNWKS